MDISLFVSDVCSDVYVLLEASCVWGNELGGVEWDG